MKLQVRNLEELLAKLDKITFDTLGDDNMSFKGEHEGNEVQVGLTYRLAKNYHDIARMPVQIQFRLSVNGAHVLIWGAEDNKACAEMVRWFQTKKGVVGLADMKRRERAKDEAKDFFNNL